MKRKKKRPLKKKNKKILVFSIMLAAAAAAWIFVGKCPGRFTGRACLVEFPGGGEICAEKAVTAGERRTGMMFRSRLKENEGMLFIFKEEGKKRFWMKNTFVDLDIVFLDGDFRITRIFTGVPRSSMEASPESVARVAAPAKYVLEMKAGNCEKYGLKEGDRLKVEF